MKHSVEYEPTGGGGGGGVSIYRQPPVKPALIDVSKYFSLQASQANLLVVWQYIIPSLTPILLIFFYYSNF